jgi:hypothetical protein
MVYSLTQHIMNKTEHIEIPLSKTKMILIFLGSLLFVALGFWMSINTPKSIHWLYGNPTVVLIIGIITMLFFGLVAITMFRKFLDNKPGLIISREGVTDNSSGVSAGLIPWCDIQEITIAQVINQRFLMFIVNNPEAYLDRVKNPLKRNAMKINYKTYGSPISISSNALQTNFDNLHKLLLEKMNEFKS